MSEEQQGAAGSKPSMATSFARTGFAKLVNSTAGRIVRIVAGLGLIAWGYYGFSGTASTAIIVVGFVPLLAGLFDLCLVSAILGGSISGKKVRAASS